MPVYKDEKRKTWMVRFRYKDWKGDSINVTKRGFKTKHDAVEWEMNFKLEKAGSTDMLFSDYVERYKKDIYPRLKLSTTITKGAIIDKHIVPYFKDKKLIDITTADIIQWQNELITFRDPNTGEPFKKSYLKTVHNQISALFNYAVRVYGLSCNPAAKAGNMGSEKEIKLNFWTKEEYLRFLDEIMDCPLAYYCFEVLYWTGIREGELLALNVEDIDFDAKRLSITKTFHHIDGKDVITTPKTIKSVRSIVLPDFLVDELREYVDMMYEAKPTDRLFPVGKSFLCRKLHDGASKAGLKQIRVHDLRHSHVSLLINMGYSAVAIAERLGHESVVITYRYAHLFPTVQTDMAFKLDKEKEV